MGFLVWDLDSLKWGPSREEPKRLDPRPGKSGTGVNLVLYVSVTSHEFVRDPESHLGC